MATVAAVEGIKTLGVALVGAGYWGPNLARNFAASQLCELRWVCDVRHERAASPWRGAAQATTSLDAVLNDPQVEAVAVATPAATHAAIVRACLEADRHVLVEKPLASSVAEARELVTIAQQRGLVLMCDHTYCFAPAVQRIRAVVRSGALGAIRYVDSIRVNRGFVQPDVDVFWDLAHHDLAILDFVLPSSQAVVAVAAQGMDPIAAGRSCLGYLTLRLGRGANNRASAHIHVSWLRPEKVRTMVIGGADQTLVWDDLDPIALRLYASTRGGAGERDVGGGFESANSHRVDGMAVPALPVREPLSEVVREFAAAIRERRAPAIDPSAELRVLAVLEAVSRSLDRDGAFVAVEADRRTVCAT